MRRHAVVLVHGPSPLRIKRKLWPPPLAALSTPTRFLLVLWQLLDMRDSSPSGRQPLGASSWCKSHPISECWC